MFEYEVSESEVVRYLGFRKGFAINDTIMAMIGDCISEMKQRVIPREVHRFFEVHFEDESIELAGMRISSGNLTRNLAGCKEAVMMAVTLGPEPDRMVRREELRSMTRAMVLQAVGAAMTESWCDEVNLRIKKEAAERGLYARPRFSPGYGDFPLGFQRDFERILNMPKEIGVSLSDTLLMTPTKSVTAVIGLSGTEYNCLLEGCEICERRNSCEFSRVR